MIEQARFERVLHALEAELIERDAELAASVAALGGLRDADNDDEHDPDGAPVSVEWSRLAGIRRELRAELASVRAAQARLAAGRFGVCARCGGAIDPARLEARPTAELCIDCARRATRI